MRIALGLCYKGTAYHGWQTQSAGRTLQDGLETALSRFADEPIKTMSSGRTDSGVHALNQVVHFDTSRTNRELFGWVRGTNRYLPADIGVQWSRFVSDEFHARHSALGRRYTYLVLEAPVRPVLEGSLCGWVFRPLNEVWMIAGARYLIGEHDFSALRSAECQAPSPIRELRTIHIRRVGAYWRFDFEGNAFLHHMIRNIMGCLLAIGQGQQPPEWMDEVLKSRDRRQAAPTFMPDGLYFLGPHYAPTFEIPMRTAAFDWLPS